MAYLLIIIAAFVHALWNSMMKESEDRLLTLASIRCIGLLFGILIVIISPVPELETLIYIAVSALLFFIYYIFLIKNYGVGEFSVVYPLARGVAPLLVLSFGFFATNEFLTASEIAAILLISSGIVILAISGESVTFKSIAYALATASAIAAYTISCGLGVRQGGSFLTFAGYLEMLTGIGVLLFLGLTRKLNPVRCILQGSGQGVLAGVLSVMGFSLALWAMTQVPLATVAVLRETSIIFAGLIGTFYLNEGRKGLRLSSACIVTCGVILLGSEI